MTSLKLILPSFVELFFSDRLFALCLAGGTKLQHITQVSDDLDNRTNSNETVEMYCYVIAYLN